MRLLSPNLAFVAGTLHKRLELIEHDGRWYLFTF